MAVIVQTEECGVVFSVLFNVIDLELWFYKNCCFFFLQGQTVWKCSGCNKTSNYLFFPTAYVLDVSSCTTLAE